MPELTPLDLTAMPPMIDWDKIIRETTTTPTLQVVVNPLLRRGSPIHDRAFEALRELGADYVRFVPWYPYPHDSIAELYPPADGKTSWNFASIDPFTVDFLEATQGHPVMLNFSTIPPWMFKADHVVPYPEDPDQPIWNYQVGTELRDPTLKEVSEYFARLVSWYTKGGFTDELGVWHESGHHYKIDYWEVLNEPDFEHDTTPEMYTERYDAIVSAIRKVNPEMKFVGLSLAMPGLHPDFFEYFLNPKNHQAGIPLDMISYHFYAVPAGDETLDVEQHTYFAQADGFITTVRYIEEIRKRLSPATQTTANELGVIRADDLLQFMPGHVAKEIPDAYWNLAGAMYAYVFANLARLGIEIAGESQLVGYPSQFPSVSMVDWNSGAPNARLRVLELLKNHIAPSDRVVATVTGGMAPSPFYSAQAFLAVDGRRKLLLISKRDRPIDLKLPGFGGAKVTIVDQITAGRPPRSETLNGENLRLRGFAVAVAELS
ncbi:MAG: glycosyl hydrolase family 39 [Anaerolineaceae bacterium]|nr:glycosyl hydrolase family 39 [Anaerolineaceae bacterium]